MNLSFETKCVYDKVAGAGANCDHQNSKLRAVAGAEGFRVAKLRVRQLKIGRKSCFAKYHLDEFQSGSGTETFAFGLRLILTSVS